MPVLELPAAGDALTLAHRTTPREQLGNAVTTIYQTSAIISRDGDPRVLIDLHAIISPKVCDRFGRPCLAGLFYLFPALRLIGVRYDMHSLPADDIIRVASRMVDARTVRDFPSPSR